MLSIQDKALDILPSLFRYEPESGTLYQKTGKSLDREITNLDDNGFLCTPITINNNRSIYMAHDIVWAIVYGKWPEEPIIHADGININNKIENLIETGAYFCKKIAEAKIEGKEEKNDTKGINGVSFQKARGKYIAYLRHNSKLVYLGSFEKLEDAVAQRVNGEMNVELHKNGQELTSDVPLSLKREIIGYKNGTNFKKARARGKRKMSTKFNGISKLVRLNKYEALIRLDGTSFILGVFDNIKDAKSARIDAREAILKQKLGEDFTSCRCEKLISHLKRKKSKKT